jgi:hypothetical protein
MITSAATRTERLREVPEGSQEHSPSRDVSASADKIIWVRVARARRPCNECGRLTNYVERKEGSPYGWRLCWKHLDPKGVVVKDFRGSWPP